MSVSTTGGSAAPEHSSPNAQALTREIAEEKIAAMLHRRLTPSERLHEISMAAIARKPAEPMTDVEVTRSAVNGRYGFKVAVSHSDPLEAERAAGEIADRLAVKYAVPDTNGGEK